MEPLLMGIAGGGLVITLASLMLSIMAFRRAGIDWKALDQWEVETKGRLIHAGNEEYTHRLKVFDERLDEAQKHENRVNGMIGRGIRTARSLGVDENGEPIQRFPLPSEIINQAPQPENNSQPTGMKRQFDR